MSKRPSREEILRLAKLRKEHNQEHNQTECSKNPVSSETKKSEPKNSETMDRPNRMDLSNKMDLIKEKFSEQSKRPKKSKSISEQIIDNIYRILPEGFTMIYLLKQNSNLPFCFAGDQRIKKIYVFCTDYGLSSYHQKEMERLNISEDKLVFKYSSFNYYPPDSSEPYVIFSDPFDKKPEYAKDLRDVYIQGETIRYIMDSYFPKLFAFYLPNNIIISDQYNYEKTEIEKDELCLIEKRILFSDIIDYPKNPELLKSNLTKWEQGLKQYLTNLFLNLFDHTYDDVSILKIIKPQDIPIQKNEEEKKLAVCLAQASYLLNENNGNMKIWKEAFTNISVNPENNYERLEALGDRILESVFSEFVFTKYPNTTPKELTLIKSSYMSKIFQSQISRIMGLDKWVLIASRTNINISEDLFEAFFGALFRTIQNTMDRGIAYQYCYELLRLIVMDIEMIAQKDSKTYVKELFQKMNVKPEEVNSYPLPDKGFETKILLSREAQDFLIRCEMMKRNESVLIGIGKGNTVKSSKHNAYKNAVAFLDGKEITMEWANREKIKKELNHPQLEPHTKVIREMLKKTKFDLFYFNVPKTTYTEGSMVIQMVAENSKDANHKKVILGSIHLNREDDEMQKKSELMKYVIKKLEEKL